MGGSEATKTLPFGFPNAPALFGGVCMTLKIQPTPILKGEDAERFEIRIFQDLKKPSKLIETPKLEQARELVVAYIKNEGMR